MVGSSTISRDAWTLRSVEPGPEGLSVEYANGRRSLFHSIWLRDNCRCDACGMPETGRRTLRLTGLDLSVVATRAVIGRDDTLEIDWSDGHRSRFTGEWLKTHAYDDAARRERAFRPRIWDDAVRKSPPVMSFPEVAGDDRLYLRMLQTVRDLGLCFLRGAPAEAGRLEPFARRIGPIQESNFGRIQDLVVDETKQSVANRTIALKPHTDEPYRASPPGILLFHCIATDVTGAGSSTFMDGFELAEILRAEDPEGFAALTRNRMAFRRHFAGDVDIITEFPALSVDEFGNLMGVRINDRVAAPLAIRPDEVAAHYRGMKRLLELAEDPARMLLLTLRPGDVAVFDNHRMLHGRTELTMKGKRWLQWLQVERGDFHSTLRVLADRLGETRDAKPLLRGAYG